SAESDNFVVRWGSDVSDDQAAEILAGFEISWATLVTDGGYPEPFTADIWKFNVYVGDTGPGLPSSEGAGGYYWYDAEGWPLIVLDKSLVTDSAWLEKVAAHEFFHAVQAPFEVYEYGGEGSWFWEATANWAAGEVFPDNTHYAAYLFGWAYQPHLAVDAFEYPDFSDQTDLSEVHQYGAFIWPRYLSEHAADPSLIFEAWDRAEDIDPDDPMAVLDVLAEERGFALDAAFADFAVRNVTWDYADGDAYEDWVDEYEHYFPSARIAADHDGHSGGWRSVDGDLETELWGVSYVRVRSPVSPFEVAFDTNPDAWPLTAWRVQVVAVMPLGYEVHEVEVVEGQASTVLDLDPNASQAWLVVTPTSRRGVPDEAAPWTY
ncbi:MAG: hypothetical protein GY884_33890, partial [Proteobacteria bacterium]|nr:hypothetical protein [Pseudomonadota bacterium]